MPLHGAPSKEGEEETTEEEGDEGLGEEEGESDGGESDWSECDEEEGEEEEPAANAAAAAVGLRPSRRAATDARNMLAAVKYIGLTTHEGAKKHHSRVISAVFRAAAKPALLIFMETALVDFVKVAYNYGKIFPTLRVA
jgi:hypothetical protein